MLLPTISFRIERWKFNKDYGIYVSTLGNFKDRYKRRLPIKINEYGYCCVKTEVPSDPWKLAHRIVMHTWKPIPDAENLTVDHLDHNKRNNGVKNLEWVTKKENQARAAADFIFMGMTKKKAKEMAKKAWQNSIVGVKINDDIIDFNADAIYNIIVPKYFPDYPKNKIETILSHIWDRSNMTGYAKISKTLKLEVIRKEQQMLVPIDKNISVTSDFIMILMAIKYTPEEFSEICDKTFSTIANSYRFLCLSKKEIEKMSYQMYWELLLKGDEDYDTD